MKRIKNKNEQKNKCIDYGNLAWVSTTRLNQGSKTPARIKPTFTS
jgi:hypothetical protein